MKTAVQQIRRMRGGSQSHLMRCDDDDYYLVKFQNNPQHCRTLVNEMFASSMAARLGICVPPVEVIDVSPTLINYTPDLAIQMANGQTPCAPGKQFGSKFVIPSPLVATYDFFPDHDLTQITNVEDFCGVFVLDKWLCNTDRRQALFLRQRQISRAGTPRDSYRVTMIDHGFCFNGKEWNFPDAPLFGLYANRWVYRSVTSIESFLPWLMRLESEITIEMMVEDLDRIPDEWFGASRAEFETIIDRLYSRRKRVQELLWSTRNAVCEAFPNWHKYSSRLNSSRSEPHIDRVA